MGFISARLCIFEQCEKTLPPPTSVYYLLLPWQGLFCRSLEHKEVFFLHTPTLAARSSLGLGRREDFPSSLLARISTFPDLAAFFFSHEPESCWAQTNVTEDVTARGEEE